VSERLSPSVTALLVLLAAGAAAGGCGGAETEAMGTGGSSATGGASATGGTNGTGGVTGTGGATGGLPAGWLYTSGNKVYVSDGQGSGSVWVGRGVNIDDVFFCGYDTTLWMPMPEQTVETIAATLIATWKPTFFRVSLSMDSFMPTVSWLSNPAQYKTPMTAVINSIGGHAGVYVLVTLRSDASMIDGDAATGAEATLLPSDGTTTPNKTMFPTGTDAVYQALVDSFASSAFVLFGISNEPGGNLLSDQKLAAAMSHAVGVIRAEEDKLGVPHHLVSVQGNDWTSNIAAYDSAPLSYDNVVYEVHGYPPTTASYTFPHIPVILGEYGSLDSGSAPAFYADVESKQIPNLAWDADPYNDCAPDLLDVNYMDSTLTPSTWGAIVMSYLTSHAH
jgi:hypothetical protein